MNACEAHVSKDAGATAGPVLPFNLDYFWDWMYGTGSDLNLARMVQFYEENQNQHISEIYCKNTFAEASG